MSNRQFKRRKRDSGSSDEESDNLNLSTYEIQMSPVPSLVSSESSVGGNAQNDTSSESEEELEGELGKESHVPEVSQEDIVITESFLSEDQTSQSQVDHDEWGMDVTSLDTSVGSIRQVIGGSTNNNTNILQTSVAEASIIQDISDSSDSSEDSDTDSDESEGDINDASDIYSSEEDITITASEDQPVYDGAPLTINDGMVAVLSYVIRHELNGREIVDLLELINLFCKKEKNEMITSLYFFKKYFSCLHCPVVYHYYCSGCYFKLKNKEMKCPHAAKHPLSSGISTFVEMPLIPQLQSLFTQEEFVSNLNFRHTRSKGCEENLEDIYDGQIYKELAAKGFLSKDKPLNFSLIMNTDGVPVFKSTGKSMWPVFFSINELPPHLRFLKKFTLIGGIWYGGHPHANLILEPLLNSFKDIQKGFNVTPPNSDKSATAKGVLIAATSDLPAKVMICGMASYSGAFGCQICKIPGGSVKIAKKKKKDAKKNEEQPVDTTSVWVYRFQDGLDLRSHSETVQLGQQAQKILQETSDPETNVLGVKFPSALFKMMYDGIRGFAIDDLHTLYLGVTKTLIRLHFQSKHSHEPFYLGPHLSVVDQRIMAPCEKKNILPMYW